MVYNDRNVISSGDDARIEPLVGRLVYVADSVEDLRQYVEEDDDRACQFFCYSTVSDDGLPAYVTTHGWFYYMYAVPVGDVRAKMTLDDALACVRVSPAGLEGRTAFFCDGLSSALHYLFSHGTSLPDEMLSNGFFSRPDTKLGMVGRVHGLSEYIAHPFKIYARDGSGLCGKYTFAVPLDDPLEPPSEYSDKPFPCG